MPKEIKQGGFSGQVRHRWPAQLARRVGDIGAVAGGITPTPSVSWISREAVTRLISLRLSAGHQKSGCTQLLSNRIHQPKLDVGIARLRSDVG